MTTVPPSALDVVLVEFLPSGGMFQFSFQFADALAQSGHRVTLLTGPGPELVSRRTNFTVIDTLPTWNPNAPEGSASSTWRRKVRRVGRALRLLLAWLQVLGYLRRHRCDVVQFGELRFPLDSVCLLAVARFGRARSVVDVAHNPLPYDVNSKDQSVEKGGRLLRALLRRAYEACDVVLVLGDGPRAELLANFPSVRRCVVCGHGDYSGALSPVEIPPPSAAPPDALSFGAWTKYKNIPLLLDAFALVRTELPEARLTVAGPVMPDVDLAALTARATQIGQVDLRPDYVPMDDVADLFGRHRVVMFTYETVNISGSVHMAYTFGRPVVATRVGSMTDVVADGVTGFLASPNPAEIARAMLQLLRDPDLADRMGRAGARRAEEGSSWSSVADLAVAAYRDSLAPAPTQPQ